MTMNRKEYDTPKGKAVFEYDGNGVGRITLECMDMLMDMVASSMWIPCSERLPSKGVPVLVNGIMEDAPPITISVDAPLYYEEGWINAWMPLPEPWKGADDE